MKFVVRPKSEEVKKALEEFAEGFNAEYEEEEKRRNIILPTLIAIVDESEDSYCLKIPFKEFGLMKMITGWRKKLIKNLESYLKKKGCEVDVEYQKE